MSALALRGYYAILDLKGPARPPENDDELDGLVRELLAAEPCFLQIRAKGLPAAELRAAAARALPLCRAAGVPLCVNDRLDVALAVGADAVHVGQDDLPLAEVKRLAAGRVRVGVSTHNPEQARAALDGGADYLGFGPVFPTRSKQNPDPVVGLTALEEVARAAAPTPVVAIGGITLETVRLVASAGANAAAVISAVEAASDRTAAGRQVAAAFASA
jgi:thiamine-phosphate pyrophosphorylase